MSHALKTAVIILLAAGALAGCKHLYGGGDVGRLAAVQTLNRS